MYIVSWWNELDRKVSSVATHEIHAIRDLVFLLESKKTRFKVADRLGVVTPSHFGWGHFDFWLNTAEAPMFTD